MLLRVLVCFLYKNLKLIPFIIGFYRYLLCVLLSIPTDAEFVKLSSKSHNVKMEEITKRALRNFGNIILFLNNIYLDVLQMTNVEFWIAGFTLKYTTRNQRVKPDLMCVLCASGCNKNIVNYSCIMYIIHVL
jgi:hypothetical protein